MTRLTRQIATCLQLWKGASVETGHTPSSFRPDKMGAFLREGRVGLDWSPVQHQHFGVLVNSKIPRSSRAPPSLRRVLSAAWNSASLFTSGDFGTCAFVRGRNALTCESGNGFGTPPNATAILPPVSSTCRTPGSCLSSTLDSRHGHTLDQSLLSPAPVQFDTAQQALSSCCRSIQTFRDFLLSPSETRTR